MDYITVDPAARRLYVPRGDHMVAYDADALTEVGQIPGVAGEHGVVIDPKNGHGFISGAARSRFLIPQPSSRLPAFPCRAGRTESHSIPRLNASMSQPSGAQYHRHNAADNSVVGRWIPSARE